MGIKIFPQKSKSDIENYSAPKSSTNTTEELDSVEIEKTYKMTEDNKIVFNFKHNKDKYDELTALIERQKNLLKIEDPDATQAILFKLKKFKDLIKSEEEKKKFDEFIIAIGYNYVVFNDKIKDLFICFKKNYLDTQNFLLLYLKGKKNLLQDLTDATANENKGKEEFMGKLKQFPRFEEQINYINTFTQSISPDLKDLIFDKEKLKKYYSENESKFTDVLSEEKDGQIISFISCLGEVINFFKEKNDIMDKFGELTSKKSEVFAYVLENNESLERLTFVETMNELTDYFQIMLYHRFIRHIEVNYKNYSSSSK